MEASVLLPAVTGARQGAAVGVVVLQHVGDLDLIKLAPLLSQLLRTALKSLSLLCPAAHTFLFQVQFCSNAVNCEQFSQHLPLSQTDSIKFKTRSNKHT